MGKRRSNERGTAIIEVALTLPLVLLISVGIFEFGRAYQTWEVLTNAAREGARIAILPSPADQVDARVRDFLANGGLVSDSSVGVSVTATTVSIGDAGTASASKVTISYPFSFIVLQPVAQLVVAGSMVGAPFTFNVSSTMRNETQF